MPKTGGLVLIFVGSQGFFCLVFRNDVKAENCDYDRCEDTTVHDQSTVAVNENVVYHPGKRI